MKGKKRTMAAALLLACFLAAGTGCATEPREAEPLPVTEEKPEPNPAEGVPTQEKAPAAEEPSEETASQPEQQPLPSSETAPTAETVSVPANQPYELFSIQSSLVQAELWTQGSDTEEFRSATITDAASLEQIRQTINSLEEQPGGSRPDTPSPGPWTGQLDLTLADGSQYSYGLWMAPDSQDLVLDATIWVDASGQNRPAARTDYTAPGTDLRQLLDQLIQQQGEPMVSMDPKTWVAEGMCYLLCDNQNRLAVWLDGNPFAGIQELEPLEAEQLGQRKDGWELRLTGEYTPLRYELYENGLKVEYYNTGVTYTYRLTAAQRQQLDTACAKDAHANRMVFPIGQPNDAFAAYFVGQSYLAPVSTSQVGIYNVTFEPGCRNNWHIHHAKEGGGQILLCLAGEGWYQEWGKAPQRLHPGDVVNIPVGVKHWHGAAADSWFSHLAVEVPAVEGSNEWLEAVDDAAYGALSEAQPQ